MKRNSPAASFLPFLMATVISLALLSVSGCARAPEVFFSASATSGAAPLAVSFTDQSKNKPTGWSWDFGDGSSSTEQSPSHAYTRAGTYTVKLTATNEKGSSSAPTPAVITVSPGALDKVSLGPESVALSPQGEQSFTAKTFDAYGNEISGVSLTWAVEAAAGSISPQGSLIAGTKAGSYEKAVKVEASHQGVNRSATASLTIKPDPLDKVTLIPASAELNIGGTQQYQAKGFDRFGNEIPALAFSWTTTAGTVDSKGSFAAGTKAGAFPEAVKAEAIYLNASRTGVAGVTIKPDPLDRITLAPASSTVAAQAAQQFTVKAQDKHGNDVPGLTAVWSLVNGGGSVDQKGLFTAGTIAASYGDTLLVRVTQGTVEKEAKASVVVAPGPLDKIVLAPNPADIGIGMKQQFVAGGADQFGNRISGLTFTWSVEAGGGAIDAAGMFTASVNPGTFGNTVKATATRDGVTRSGAAGVTVQPDRLLFLSDRDREDELFELYTMDLDGKNVERLNTGGLSPAQFSWSPDGKRVVYGIVTDQEGTLVAMSDDGSWKMSLLAGSRAFEPAWSPDGSKIAFQSWKDDNGEIYVMDVDGGKVTRLTNNKNYDDLPSWSPDGKRIAFVSDRDGNIEIYAMNADGSDQRRLTNHPAQDQAPAWSPDGAEIAFQSGRDAQEWGIFIINADGSNVRSLAIDANFPSWSPDGKRIAFHSHRNVQGKAEIYVMHRDGSNPARVTVNEDKDFIPRWSPRKKGVEVGEASVVIPRSTVVKELTVEELTARASKAVVRIKTDLASGSGFIIDPTGIILTNNHVVSDAKEITVFLTDGSSQPGTVVGRDLVRDLAVVKINAAGLPSLELSDPSEVSLGSTAIVIGYPLGEKTATVTRGIISAFKPDGGRNIAWVQTDAAINPGNSGGPIFNLRGQVIGVVAAKYAGIGLEGLGFGISTTTVRLYLDRIKAGGTITS